MAVRDWLNDHPWVAAVAAGVVLVLVIIFVSVRGFGGGPARTVATEAWFFDTGTGTLFAANRELLPPIPAPSDSGGAGGASGVRARVFSCDGCRGDPLANVAFLERYTPAGRAAAEELRSLPVEGGGGAAVRGQLSQRASEGLQFASTEAPDVWVPATSPSGRAMTVAATTVCRDGKSPRECFVE